MKFGGLFTAVGVLIVLGGLVWWFNKHPTTDTASKTPPAPKLISVDPKQIEDIRLVKPGADPIELAKLAGTWTITKPTAMPADQDAVTMLTTSLATLNADRLIDDHPSSLSDFGLTNPLEEVDLTLKGGKTTKLLIGSDTPASTGTYAKLESDPKVYTLPSYLKPSFDKSVNDLRDKRLLTFNQDKLTAVAITGKGQSFEFGKNAQGDWQIVKPKPMRADSLLVDDLIRKLKDAKMDLTAANYDLKPSPPSSLRPRKSVPRRRRITWERRPSRSARATRKTPKTAVITPRAQRWPAFTKWRATSATVWARAPTITATRSCSISVSTIRRNWRSTAWPTRSRAISGWPARPRMRPAAYRP